MRTIARLSILIAACSVLSGCFHQPFSVRVQTVRARIVSLDERITLLEESGVFGTAAVFASSADVASTALPGRPGSAPAADFGTSILDGAAMTALDQAVVQGAPVPGGVPIAAPLSGIPGAIDLPVAAGQSAVESSGSYRLPAVPFDTRQALKKLVRGITNILTGWVEIPKRIHQTSHTNGPGAGFTYGVLRGVGYGFIRTAAGGYETVTFPFPAPPGYRPVMQPEYLFLCCPEAQ